MPSSLKAHLSVIADHLGRYRVEVAELATAGGLDPEAPVVSALYEAERALRNALRAVDHAKSLAG